MNRIALAVTMLLLPIISFAQTVTVLCPSTPTVTTPTGASVQVTCPVVVVPPPPPPTPPPPPVVVPPPPTLTAPVKLIKWGWDSPIPQFIKENIASMEQHPFDGVGIQIAYEHPIPIGDNTTDQLSSHIFTRQPLNFNDPTLQSELNILKAILFKKFTDNFWSIYLTSNYESIFVDWFDDDWATYTNNMKLAARVAKQAGLKGIVLDTENFHTLNPLQYSGLKYSSTKTFAEYKAQVKSRGREVMNAMISEHPDIVVLLTLASGTKAFSASIGFPDANNLLPSFIDGMLEAIGAMPASGLRPTLIDGFETSYPYRTESEFIQGKNFIKTAGRTYSVIPAIYDQHIKAGFGIWADNGSVYNSCGTRQAWSASNFNCNWFTPNELKTAIYSAMKTADPGGYVWVWSERVHWWTPNSCAWCTGGLPQAYVDAVRDGKNQYLVTQPSVTPPPPTPSPVPLPAPVPPPPVVVPPPPPVSSSALIGWWKFDESSGTSATDSSGNGKTGSLVNGPGWTAGKFGNALNLDGANDHVAVSTPIVGNSAAHSVSLWVKTSNPNSQEAYSEGNLTGSAFMHIKLNDDNAPGDVEYCEGDDALLFACINTPSLSITNGQWHNIVSVQESKSLRRLYVDGVLISSNTTTIGTQTFNATTIGALRCCNGNFYFFNGQIDDVRAYNRVLSASEVQAIYTGGT